MSFEFFISGRYLKTRQKQAFISLITLLSIAGVVVGVMALIVVIAVMTGAESHFKSSILKAQSHIIILRHGDSFSDYRHVIDEVKKEEGVESATPFVSTQVMLRSSDGVSGAVIRGIDPESARQEIKDSQNVSLQFKLMKNKEEKSINKIPGIILGKELANNLGVIDEDIIYLISPKATLSPVGHIPVMKRFKVAGQFKSGVYGYDESLAYIHLNDAQKILNIGDAVTGIGVQVKNIYKAKEIADRIVENLGFPFWARDWIQMNRNLFTALKLEKIAMFIILILIVLVAAFNIASSLIMLVMGKSKDIAILKAMGATDKSIRKIFVLNGMIIGSIGTGVGIILGIIICFILKHYKFINLPGNVYYFTTIPVQLEIFNVLIIAFAALGICFISTLYPAHHASKVNTVEAIRYG